MGSFLLISFSLEKIAKQECIPVGCVPFAAAAVFPGGRGAWSWGSLLLGGCLLLGVSAPRRVSAPGGCLLPGAGVCSGGCLLPGGGVSAPGGCLVLGGGIPACTEADTHTPPPVNRMTDRCKNITFATSLRTVIKPGTSL